MKISMHMIAHWLNGYEFESNIVRGRRGIDGVRLGKRPIEDDKNESEHTVYVFGTEQNTSSIVFEEDSINITGHSVEEILNSLLDCIDYYDTMERRMLSALSLFRPEEQLLYECQNLIGPSFILSKDYVYLAITKGNTGSFINQWWDEAEKTRRVPMSLAFGMADNEIFSLFKKDFHQEVFYESKADPFSYTLVNSYHSKDREVLGVIVMTSDKEITEFEKDVSEILRRMLERRYADFLSAEPTEVSYMGDFFFKNILQGQDPALNVTYLRTQNHLDDRYKFCILSVDNVDSFKTIEIRNCLDIYYRNTIHTEFENHMAILFYYRNNSQPSFSHFESIGKRFDICFGKSLDFNDLSLCKYYYRQASFAESIGSDQKIQGVYNFQNVACSFMLHNSKDDLIYARHPLIAYINDDRSFESEEYLDTIKEYLLNERSLDKTAAKLFVHKNTVLNRIHKIKNLYPIDLNDPYERLYLLISLMI